MDLTVSCGCNCPNGLMLKVTGASLPAFQAAIAKGQFTGHTCLDCGCEHTLADGGNQVNVVPVPKPKVSSISPTTAPAAGGTPIVVSGHALNAGNLVVRFDGVPGQNPRSRTGGGATVDSPSLAVIVNTQGAIVGALGPGDTVTGSMSGKTATIVLMDPGTAIRLTAVSGALTPGEWLQKDANNKVQVAASAIYRPVDVTVENERGSRNSHARLIGAFTATP